MERLSDDFIESVNSRLWADAVVEFGSKFAVSSDRASRISEYIRALYVLQVFVVGKGGSLDNAHSELRSYSVSDMTIDRLCEDGILSGGSVDVSRAVSRKARLKAFEEWAKEHRGEQFSTDLLMEKAGFSRGPVLEYLKVSRLFVKVKRGVFQVVDK